MDMLTIPPTLPAGPVVALPTPPVSRPVSPPEGWKAWVEQGCEGDVVDLSDFIPLGLIPHGLPRSEHARDP